jgi:uncharacterized protein DUF1207
MSSSPILAALWLSTLFIFLPPVRSAAQERLFPQVTSFELPEASPRVHGLVGRVLSIRRGDNDFGTEPEAEAAVGEDFPIFALRRGPRPVTLGFGSEVYGRFSLADRKSALISNDWMVGLNVTANLGKWSLTGEVYHESSHLGDEYRDRFDARRIDWTREVASAWAGYSVGSWRFTGNLSYVLLDELHLEPLAAAMGMDFRGGEFGRLLGGRVQPVAGLFLDGAAETAWRISASAKLGLAVSALGSGREVGIALIAHDGLSTQRQFYAGESRYIGGELRFDF